MKSLKLAFFCALILTSFMASAQDPIRELTCTSGNVKRFTVTLDPSTYEEGSGLIRPLNAKLNDNFYDVPEMVCVGALPEDLVCMGYINRSSELVIEARTSLEGQNIVVKYSTVRGNGPKNTTLKCKLE